MSYAKFSKTSFQTFLALILAFPGIAVRGESIPFDPPRWQMDNARVIEHLGQKAMMGTALRMGKAE